MYIIELTIPTITEAVLVKELQPAAMENSPQSEAFIAVIGSGSTFLPPFEFSSKKMSMSK